MTGKEKSQDKPAGGSATHFENGSDISDHLAGMVERESTERDPKKDEDDASGSPGVTTGVPQNVHFERVRPWKHVTVWMIGVVIASLTPILWSYISNAPRSTPPSIYQLLGKGDLFLISVVVLIAGITEIILLTKRIQQDFTVALLIIGGFLFVIVDAAKYAGASTVTDSPVIMPHSVAFWSIAAFAVSTIHSSICVWLAAGVR